MSDTAQAPGVDVETASRAVGAAQRLVDLSLRALAEASSVDGRLDMASIDRHQVVGYDLAYCASGLDGARLVLAGYAGQGEVEADLAVAFAADVVADLRARLDGRLAAFGVDRADWDGTLDSPEVRALLDAGRSPLLLEHLATAAGSGSIPGGPRHLDEEFEMMVEAFKALGEDKIRPQAEHVHRTNADLPEDVIEAVAAMGGFGLTIPEEYGGSAGAGVDHTMAMVIATEWLTWASLGIGGALITRPEILSKAIVGYGTQEQKQRWLPGIASGEKMVGVAVTEPDFGSDVANIKVRAQRTEAGDGYLVNGVKTWCTFAGRADYLMLLARTGASEDGHKGLSLFVVPKAPAPGHEFVETATHAHGAGRMEGRAIDTLGYRGMHSYEVSFDNWFVPAADLVGEVEGKGFYMQMDAFANGRVQTAARAVGLMQAAFEAALAYSRERRVFGRLLGEYQLTQAKLARMAALIQSCRQYTYAVARMLSAGGSSGQREASMVKMYACRAAEWVTREAMQIHGGMGYAEEYDVSRYFVDARVLSIFEGAEEILALRVIIRRLLEDALAAG
ncbi:MAG: acyl-CoA/acyl-ACP dehydrogenase [Acidimicrobiia bacterium]|nr:acyl-CoA/acyl-ACP dehydrogenase [Acidimicrobiia bacterium]